MKKTLSMFLALCMLVTLLPVTATAEEIHTPIVASGEIINFALLTETTKEVSLGTSIEDLELPKTLTATVRTAVPGDENFTQDSDSPETATPTTAAEPEWEEATMEIPVKWASPDYDMDTRGEYVFSPVIEGFTVSAPLPELTVTVGTAMMGKGMMTPLSGGSEYAIWVSGVQVTDENKADVLGASDGDGATVSFDPDTSTLTLNGANITAMYYNTVGINNCQYGIYSELNKQLNLVVTGTNYITCPSDSKYSYAIYTVWPLSISESGIGSLTLESDGSSVRYGIRCEGKLTIVSGTITAIGKTSTSSTSIGIYGRPIEILGGQVTATATGTASTGMYSGDRITIHGGKVTAIGNTGLAAYNATTDLNIYGGEVSAIGTGTYSIHNGIKGKVNLTGGTLTATSAQKALNGTLSFSGAGAMASEHQDGKDAVAYNAENNDSYKFLQVKSATVTIAQGDAVSSIQTSIQEKLDDTGITTVVVNGSKTNADQKLELTIPAGKTLQWGATYRASATFGATTDALINLLDASVGTLEVTADGLLDGGENSVINAVNSATDIIIKGKAQSNADKYMIRALGNVTVIGTGSVVENTSEFAMASVIDLLRGDVFVSNGGKVIANGFNSTVIMSKGNVTVTGAGSLVENTSAIATGGAAVISASGSDKTVSVLEGGAVSAKGNQAAILSMGNVKVSGKVTASIGSAIILYNNDASVTVDNGGLVFSPQLELSKTTTDSLKASNNTIGGVILKYYTPSVPESLSIYTLNGTGMLIGWDKTQGTAYSIGDITAISAFSVSGNGKAKWAMNGAESGIAYTYDSNTGFIPLNVTLSDANVAGAGVFSVGAIISRTHNSIYFSSPNFISGNPGNQVIEYAISTDNAVVPTSGWQTGTTFNGLSPDTTYYIWARSQAKEGYNAGTAVPNSGTRTKHQNVTPSAFVDFISEKLTGLVSEGSYLISGLTVKAGVEGTIEIQNEWFGKNISIIQKGIGSTTTDSPEQVLSIPARPAAPTSSEYIVQNEITWGAGDGKIKAFISGCEYFNVGDAVWLEMEENRWVEPLTVGMYQIRKKATVSSFASAVNSIIINPAPMLSNLSVDDVTFDAVTQGYTPFHKNIVISNSGTAPARLLSVKISTDDFVLAGALTNITAGGKLESLTIIPKPGLAVGTHNATITVIYDDERTATAMVSITVNVATYTITANPTNKDFGSLTAGYSTPTSQTVTITNTGDSSVTLNQPSSSYYTIGTLSTTTLEANCMATFTVTPKVGLAVGNYNENLTVSTNHSIKATVSLSFSVRAVPTYTVTFNPNGGMVSEASRSVAPGTSVGALPIPTHSGTYSFDGWYTESNDGIQISASTTVSANVSYYAQWTYIAAIDAESSDGSSSNDNSSTVIVTSPVLYKPNSPTQGEIKVPGKVDRKGNVTVRITDKIVTDAFNKAMTDAKKNSTEQNGIAVVIRVDSGNKTGSNVKVNLPKAVQDIIIAKKIVSIIIVVDNPDIRIGIDLAAIQEINKQAKSDVNITVTRMDSSKLTRNAKKAIDSRPVFDLKVNYGKGKAVSSFGAGSVSVTIPYTLLANEKAGNVQAVYVDSKGKVHWLVNSVYDSIEKVLRFSTNHFSTYGIGYKQTNTEFTDIEGHWAKEDIEFVASRGLLSGTSKTKFSPNTAITRGMLVTALGRLSNVDVSGYAKSSFRDVKDSAYYMGYIEWANENNILNGVGKGKFAPDQSITREQLAVVMSNYAKTIGFTLPKVHIENIFTDNDKISSNAKEAMKQMQMAGVISGKNGNLYYPQGKATKAVVSVVLRRFVELAISSDTAQGWFMNDSGKWMYFKDGMPLTGSQDIYGTTYIFNKYGVTPTHQ